MIDIYIFNNYCISKIPLLCLKELIRSKEGCEQLLKLYNKINERYIYLQQSIYV